MKLKIYLLFKNKARILFKYHKLELFHILLGITLSYFMVEVSVKVINCLFWVLISYNIFCRKEIKKLKNVLDSIIKEGCTATVTDSDGNFIEYKKYVPYSFVSRTSYYDDGELKYYIRYDAYGGVVESTFYDENGERI